MASLPAALLERLSVDERSGLIRLLDLVGGELVDLYAATAKDHLESRGDDGQLFGMKIWTHGWFRYEGRVEDDPAIAVERRDGSFQLRVGRLRIGVYRQGAQLADDVHQALPDDSKTKRSYGERNAAQLSLFDIDVATCFPIPESEAALLNDLTITHFGNWREGLVKWYVGAQMTDNRGRQLWAWLERQELPEAGAQPARLVPVHPVDPDQSRVIPFDASPVEDIEVPSRTVPVRKRTTEDDSE